jgi:membrane-bound ClpP family serine protease
VHVALRYWLHQIPGFAGASLAAWFLHDARWVSPGQAMFLLALWVVKDAALYPLLKASYERPIEGLASLVGLRARVPSGFERLGFVRVRGELWKAHSSEPLADGDEVLVTGVRGRALEVCRQQNVAVSESSGNRRAR